MIEGLEKILEILARFPHDIPEAQGDEIEKIARDLLNRINPE